MKQQFEEFRQLYPGVKRGLETEFRVFTRHKDASQVVVILCQSLGAQIKARQKAKAKGEFVPNWPHLQTWLRQRRWEETLPGNDIGCINYDAYQIFD